MDLVLDSHWIILVFIVNFVHLEFLFYIAYFYICFYPRINKPNIHINNGISSFQNGLNDLNSTGFYFKSKVTEGSHEGKNMFFNC